MPAFSISIHSSSCLFKNYTTVLIRSVASMNWYIDILCFCHHLYSFLLPAFLRIIPPFLSGIPFHYATPAMRHCTSIHHSHPPITIHPSSNDSLSCSSFQRDSLSYPLLLFLLPLLRPPPSLPPPLPAPPPSPLPPPSSDGAVAKLA